MDAKHRLQSSHKCFSTRHIPIAGVKTADAHSTGTDNFQIFQLLEDGKGEKLISYILDQPYDVSVRIGMTALLSRSVLKSSDLIPSHYSSTVPTRNTDHSHLRDGFVRAMLARMKQATSAKTLSDEQAEKAGSDLDDFKGFFPSGKVSKGKYMLITRRGSDGALLLEYEVCSITFPVRFGYLQSLKAL